MASGDTEKTNRELFLLACARGLIDDAQQLIADGVPPAVTDRNGRSGAHFAAAKGELATLQLLQSKGVDVDSEDVQGRAPLHYAAMHNHEAVVRFLVNKGCWMDAHDERECTPLHLAARFGAPDAARRLLQCGAKHRLCNAWQLTPLGEALCGGHMSVCQALAKGGACTAEDVAVRVNGLTLLHVVAGMGEPVALDWLLKRGVLDVNDAQNVEQLAPLHCAVLGGNLVAVEQLMREGADVTLKGSEGQTPDDLVSQAALAAGATPACRDRIARALQAGPKRALSRPQAPKGPPLAPGEPASQVAAAGAGTCSTMSAAAQLAQARTPAEVADIMQRMPSDHQVLRVKKWAALPPGELGSVPGLSGPAASCLEQVRTAMHAAAKTAATRFVREDERFREDMRRPAIRKAVDAVIARPDNVLQYGQHAGVMACLNKLRVLNDVNKANGGGAIDLSEVMDPWTPRDDARVQDMHRAVDAAIGAAIRVLCNPQAGDQASACPDAQTREALGAPLQDAACGLEGDGAAHGAAHPKPGRWKIALMQVAQQLAALAVLFCVMWCLGMLPYQTRQRMEAGQRAYAGLEGEL